MSLSLVSSLKAIPFGGSILVFWNSEEETVPLVVDEEGALKNKELEFPREVGIISSIISQEGEVCTFGNTLEVSGWKQRLVSFDGNEFSLH